jgi:hypothetical protein
MVDVYHIELDSCDAKAILEVGDDYIQFTISEDIFVRLKLEKGDLTRSEMRDMGIELIKTRLR